MAAKAWAKSGSGPDWLDCTRYMAVIKTTHDVECSVLIEHAGVSVSYSVRATVTASWSSVAAIGGYAASAVEVHWPHREHATLEAAVFAALYVLDYRLGSERMRQSELPPA